MEETFKFCRLFLLGQDANRQISDLSLYLEKHGEQEDNPELIEKAALSLMGWSFKKHSPNIGVSFPGVDLHSPQVAKFGLTDPLPIAAAIYLQRALGATDSKLLATISNQQLDRLLEFVGTCHQLKQIKPAIASATLVICNDLLDKTKK